MNGPCLPAVKVLPVPGPLQSLSHGIVKVTVDVPMQQEYETIALAANQVCRLLSRNLIADQCLNQVFGLSLQD